MEQPPKLPHQQYRRTQYFVYPQVQIRLIVLSLLISLGSTGIIYGALRVIFANIKAIATRMKVPADHFVYQFIDNQVYLVNVLFLILVPILVLITVFVTIRFSHKFVGPMIKLKNTLNEINASGKFVELHFRKGDFYRELEEPFNKMRDKFKQ